MSSLVSVFQVLRELREAGVVRECALAGAMAALFYADAEPTRTYDQTPGLLAAQEAAQARVVGTALGHHSLSAGEVTLVDGCLPSASRFASSR